MSKMESTHAAESYPLERIEAFRDDAGPLLNNLAAAATALDDAIRDKPAIVGTLACLERWRAGAQANGLTALIQPAEAMDELLSAALMDNVEARTGASACIQEGIELLRAAWDDVTRGNQPGPNLVSFRQKVEALISGETPPVESSAANPDSPSDMERDFPARALRVPSPDITPEGDILREIAEAISAEQEMEPEGGRAIPNVVEGNETPLRESESDTEPGPANQAAGNPMNLSGGEDWAAGILNEITDALAEEMEADPKS